MAGGNAATVAGAKQRQTEQDADADDDGDSAFMLPAFLAAARQPTAVHDDAKFAEDTHNPPDARSAPAPAPLPPSAPVSRYLLLLHGVEGFGAWSDSIMDSLLAAKHTNRTWVEPCVRNGCIEPCRCGHIPEVPPFDAARAARGDDPLMLPRIDFDCKIDMHYNYPVPSRIAPAYPLSAYVDVDALRRDVYSDIITYADWCAAYTAKHGPPDDEIHRWTEQRVYCYEMDDRECANNARTVYVGDFVFPSGDVPGWRPDGRNLDFVAADTSENVFLYVYFRGAFGWPPYTHQTVPLSRWHHVAVEKLTTARFGSDGYVAFHWRSEGSVSDDQIIPCTHELLNTTARVPALLGDKPHAVIVSDMPAPGNANKMWTDYVGGDSAVKQDAMALMLKAGFLKYDALVPDVSKVDAGVLSIRDFLLAAKSNLFVTCQGEHYVDCHGCFRSGSNLVHRINLDRERAAQPTLLQWFDIKVTHLPQPLLQLAQALPPSPSPPPPPAEQPPPPAESTLSPQRKYMLLLLAVEGFGAWSDSIVETLLIAKELNRTWVEPCVRNGCVEPCRCDEIPDIPPFDAARAARGEDPLMLPRINADCKVDMHYNHPDPQAFSPAYPLRALLDVDAIRHMYNNDTITYKEWCTAYRAKRGPPPAGERRWRESKAYCYEMNERDCAFNSRVVYVGDFAFMDGDIPGWRQDGRNFAVLAEDPSENIFMFTYFRGAFGMVLRYPSMPVAAWHHAAVDRFIAEKFRGEGYAAFHWRSERNVDTNVIVPCAGELVNITRARMPVLRSPPHALLVSDMPSPNNPNKMWTDYIGGESNTHRDAMRTMLDAGFVKYDALLPDPSVVDGGVFSVRDYLFALKADIYITCQGDHWADCHGCFRAGSNIVQRITRDREAANAPVSLNWYKVNTSDLPPRLQKLDALPARMLRGGPTEAQVGNATM